MIPTRFKLAGHTITVRLVPEKDWTDDEVVGYWNSQNLTITVPSWFSESRTQQIFCHELVHAILHTMDETKLNDNEKFVDVFGSLLHQVWTTIEGEKPVTKAKSSATGVASRRRNKSSNRLRVETS